MYRSYRDMLVELKKIHSCNERYEHPMFYTDDSYKNNVKNYLDEEIFVPASIAKSWNDQNFEERKQFSEDMSLIKDELESNRNQLQQMFRYVDKIANDITQMGIKFQKHDEKEAGDVFSVAELNKEQDYEQEKETFLESTAKDLKKNRIVLGDELREQLARKSSENKKLVAQIELKTKDIEKYELQFSKLKEAYQATRKESKKNRLERNSLREELDTFKAQIGNEKVNLDELNEALRAKDSMLDNKSKLVQLLIDEKESLTFECKRVRSTYSTLQAEYTKLRKSSQSSSQTKLNINEAAQVSLDGDEKQTTNDESCLHSSTESLSVKINGLKNQLISKTKQINSLNDQLEKITKENGSVLTEKDASISCLEDLLKKNEQTLTSYDSKITILEDKLKKANRERDELNQLLIANQNAFSDDQVKSYINKIPDLNEQVKCLTDRLTSAEEDYKNILKEKEDLLPLLTSAEKEKESYQEIVTAVKAEMKAVLDQKNVVYDECKRLRSILDKNEELFSSQLKLTEQTTSSFKEQIAASNEELEKTQKELAEDECKNLKERLDKKHEQLSSTELNAALDQLKSSKQECERLNGLLRNNEDLISSKDKTIEQITLNNEKRLKILNDEWNLVRQENSSSYDECDRLKKDLKENADLLASNAAISEQTKVSYEGKINTLNQQLIALRDQKLTTDDECKKLSNQLNDQNEIISKGQTDSKEKANLQLKYDTVVSKCKNLEEQIKNLNKEKIKLCEEKVSLENKQNDNKENKEGLHYEIKSMKNVLAEKEKLIMNIEMEKGVITNSAKTYQTQVEKLKSQINETMKVQDQVEDLRAQLIRAKEKEKEYMKNINHLENEHDEKVQELESQLARAKEEGNDVHKNSQELETLKKQLNVNEKNQARYKKEKSISDDTIEKLKFELSEMTEFHSSAETEIVEMERVQFNLSEELCKVMKECDRFQNNSYELQDKIKVIESENETLKMAIDYKSDLVKLNQFHSSLTQNKEDIDVDDIPIPKRNWGENFIREKNSKEDLNGIDYDKISSDSIKPKSHVEDFDDHSSPSNDSFTQFTSVEESKDIHVKRLPSKLEPVKCGSPLSVKVKKCKSGKKSSKKNLAAPPVLGALRNIPPRPDNILPDVREHVSSPDISPQVSNVELGSSPFGGLNLPRAPSLGSLTSVSSAENTKSELKEFSPLRVRNNSLKDITPLVSKSNSLDGAPSLSKSTIKDDEQTPNYLDNMTLSSGRLSSLKNALSLGGKLSSNAEKTLSGGKLDSLKNALSFGSNQCSLADMPSLGGQLSSLKDIPSLGGKQSSLKDIPSLGGKQSTLAKKPLSGVKQGSLKNAPLLGGKQSGLADMPSLGGKQSSLKDIPSLGGKHSSLKDMPSLEGKQSTLAKKPLSGVKLGSLKNAPLLGGKQSGLADMPSLGGKQSSLKDIPSRGGKQKKVEINDSYKNRPFSEKDLVSLRTGLDSDKEEYAGQDPSERLPKQTLSIDLEFDINEELDGEEIDEELEYGDGNIDDFLGNLL